MRTYDPADHILYVHLAQDPPTPGPLPHTPDECHRLPAGYANVSPSVRLGQARAAGARAALVVLPGGSAAAVGPASAPPVLRLA